MGTTVEQQGSLYDTNPNNALFFLGKSFKFTILGLFHLGLAPFQVKKKTTAPERRPPRRSRTSVGIIEVCLMVRWYNHYDAQMQYRSNLLLNVISLTTTKTRIDGVYMQMMYIYDMIKQYNRNKTRYIYIIYILYSYT